MDMLLPGRCSGPGPSPGSSLFAPKARAYEGRGACDACCCGDDGGGMCGRAKDGGAGVSWDGPTGERVRVSLRRDERGPASAGLLPP